MKRRKRKLAGDLAAFMQQYRRKRAPHDPNDRGYDRELEAKMKRMRPEDLDELLHGDDEGPVDEHNA